MAVIERWRAKKAGGGVGAVVVAVAKYSDLFKQTFSSTYTRIVKYSKIRTAYTSRDGVEKALIQRRRAREVGGRAAALAVAVTMYSDHFKQKKAISQL